MTRTSLCLTVLMLLGLIAPGCGSPTITGWVQRADQGLRNEQTNLEVWYSLASEGLDQAEQRNIDAMFADLQLALAGDLTGVTLDAQYLTEKKILLEATLKALRERQAKLQQLKSDHLENIQQTRDALARIEELNRTRLTTQEQANLTLQQVSSLLAEIRKENDK